MLNKLNMFQLNFSNCQLQFILYLLASLWKIVRSISKIAIKHWKICFPVLFFVDLLVMASHFVVTVEHIFQKSNNKNVGLICQVYEPQRAGSLCRVYHHHHQAPFEQRFFLTKSQVLSISNQYACPHFAARGAEDMN